MEVSYGIIPLHNENGKWEVCLVLHRNGRFWGFPKGHAHADEGPLVTAKRELEEETGLRVETFLQHEPLEERYQYKRGKLIIDKQVFFYLGIVPKKPFTFSDEILDGKWVSLDHLKEEISFPEGKKLAEQLKNILTKE